MGAKSSQLSSRSGRWRGDSLRRDSCLFRRNGGDAERMPRRSCRSSRPACLANVHACLRLCRWLLSVASGLASRSTAWERGSRRHRAAATRPQAGIGRALAWACCARRKESPNSAYSGWSARVQRCAHDSSFGRPLPAYSRRLVSLQAACSLSHAYGMDASRWQQQACVWNAASGGRCVRQHGNRCDLTEVAAPE